MPRMATMVRACWCARSGRGMTRRHLRAMRVPFGAADAAIMVSIDHSEHFSMMRHSTRVMRHPASRCIGGLMMTTGHARLVFTAADWRLTMSGMRVRCGRNGPAMRNRCVRRRGWASLRGHRCCNGRCDGQGHRGQSQFHDNTPR